MRLPPHSPRALLLSACVLLLSALSGCDEAPDPTPDAGPAGDSGTAGAWDGGYTVLEEKGDWLDRGAFAPCSFDSLGSDASCEDLARFDLSRCDANALASLEGSIGVYQSDVRAETRLSDGGIRISQGTAGFELEADGGGSLNSAPFRQRRTDGGVFFLTSERTSPVPALGTFITALAGCQVPAPGLITGCYARCRNGRVTQVGTFEAQRMTWPEEAESSGGMRLLSEATVAEGRAADIYVHKDHAYVVSLPHDGAPGGLNVFDVKDREHPVLKTSISSPADTWNGVWAKGDALYIASAARGVILYDITNPAAPEYVRSVSGGSEIGAHTVLVDGDRLYAMSGGNEVLPVFDVSRPLDPVLRQSIPPHQQDGFTAPHDAFAYEGRLYVSNSTGGYTVLDVTDLDNVRYLGQYVHGGYAHHSAVGTFAGRTIAFEGAEGPSSHVRVLDVTDPARIVKIGEFRMRPSTSIHNMLLVGTKLYIAWYQEGVRVLDVSNPTQPRQVAHFNTYQDTHPLASDYYFQGTFGIRIPGDGYVYAADSVRGLLIFNQP